MRSYDEARAPELPLSFSRLLLEGARLAPALRLVGAMTMTNEVARVALHIEGAEQEIAARSTRMLGRVKRMIRAILLEELGVYRRAGVFPKNRDFTDGPIPYLIDADGTRCALAHLLESGGAGGLVARLASERNNALVHELADEPELLGWLEAAGLSVEEAARIQPSYCYAHSEGICNLPSRGFERGGAIGVVEVTTLESVAGSRAYSATVTARVDAIHGDGGGLTVGATVPLDVSSRHDAGTKFLAPIYKSVVASSDGGPGDSGADAAAADAGFATRSVRSLSGIEIRDDQLAESDGHALGKSSIVEALRSSDCGGTLAKIDSYWAETWCTGDESRGCGPCAASPGAASETAATLQILIAVVGAAVARRAMRRP